MQPHTGGVRGTVLGRAYCPHCRRDVAGGYTDRAKRKVWLRSHKRPVGPGRKWREWCPGGGLTVPVDQAAMRDWAERRRERERRRAA